MNTPRTALEECNKLVDHIEELIHPFLDTGDSRTAADFAVNIARDTCDLRQALSEALGGKPTAADVVAWRYKFYDSGWILSDDDTDIQRIIRNGMPLQRLIVHPDDTPPPPTSANGSGE